MLEKVQKYIEDNDLLNKNEYVICATSGGVDSVCLINILHSLGYKTVLAHVNHHKRKESELEAESMQKLALNLAIPFELYDYHASDDKNFQSLARKARYEFLNNLAIKYNTSFIATAHHLDDQIETIIMQQLKGSNLYGYGGISPMVELSEVKIVRPLLVASKAELYEYAKNNNLVYFEDSSNNTDDYLRNKIRHHIIPILKELNPDVLKKYHEYSVLTKEAFNFIRKISIKYLDELNNNIECSSFLKFDIAVQKDIICLLFERANVEKNNDLIMNCLDLIKSGNNASINLKKNYYFRLEYGKSKIQQTSSIKKYNEIINLEKDCIILNKYHFYFSKKIPQNNANYIKLCYNSLELPLTIRNREDGDFIQMSYGSKKVARIMIDSKISSTKRDETPLVFDAKGNLLWIYGLAKSSKVVEQKANGDIFLVCEEL